MDIEFLDESLPGLVLIYSFLTLPWVVILFLAFLKYELYFQGHMYLFVHHICFYSNIFGFETKVHTLQTLARECLTSHTLWIPLCYKRFFFPF